MVQYLPRRLLIALIGLYQRTLSPDHGPFKILYPYGFCRHHPTCSQYGKEVVRERGVIVGTGMIVKRVLSCNPWTAPDERRMTDVLLR